MHSSYKVIQCRRKSIYVITVNKGKYILKLIMYLIYFIALSLLHIAAKKITMVLREFWSAKLDNYVDQHYLARDDKTEENKQNKNAIYLFSQYPV